MDFCDKLPPFDCKGDISTLGQRWKKYKRSVEYYNAAKAITSAERKKAILLHFGGPDLQDLFETLTVADPSGHETVYTKTIEAFDNHFLREKNIPFERNVFKEMKQEEDETIDQFVTRLRRQTENCEFEASDIDNQIRDQILHKCKSQKLHEKLLDKGAKLTLKYAIEKGRSEELVTKQLESRRSVAKEKSDVNLVSETNKSKVMNEQTCYRCGQVGHFARDVKCPARNSMCRRCSRKGHWDAVCHTKLEASGTSSKYNMGQANYQGRRQPKDKKKAYVKYVDKRGSDTNSDDDVDELVSHIFAVHPDLDDIAIDITIGNANTRVLIDSGASCNILDKTSWLNLKQKDKRNIIELEKTGKRLFAYGSKRPLTVIGMFERVVKVANRECCAKFYVVDCDGNSLLGRDTAMKLGVLKIGYDVNSLNTSSCDIVNEFPDCCKGIGKLKNYQLKLHVDINVKPVAQPVRRIPFNLRHDVEVELEKMLAEDIIERVEGPTPWVSPIIVVPKANGGIRICVDMRRANEAIVRERHPIPTVDDVLYNLNGSTVFSKIDLKSAFHQLELEESSRSITTFCTHTGLFRYKRLMFGISCAPEIYQHVINQTISKCKGVYNIHDDIVVTGQSVQEHDENLRSLLKCLSENGLTVCVEKCKLRAPSVEFMGHTLSKEGISISNDKIKAIQEAPEPRTAAEVRSFLGLVNFVARYVPNLATLSEPLRRMTKKDAGFMFGQEQRRAFCLLKEILSKSVTLSYFRPGAKTAIIADASPVGIAGLVLQNQDGVEKIIYCASRSLSDVEKRYSQTEKEALSLVWACEKFGLFLHGAEFEMRTDHKPLEFIFSPRSKPSARIERWVLRLQSFTYRVKYLPGPNNIADFLSRLIPNQKTVQKQDDQEECDYVKFVATIATPHSVTTKEIERASETDEELSRVRSCIVSGKWEQCEDKPYKAISTELCQVGFVTLRGTRIVVPQSLRQRIMKIAHQGHPGIVKMKTLLRTKVWWPGIDKEAEKFCRTCRSCQIVSSYEPPEPICSTTLPTGPWQDLALDYLGPLPTGDSILVVVDYYSRYIETNVVKNTSSETTICFLKKIFRIHGLPFSLRTDNATSFTSAEFEEYLSVEGIEHRKTTPLWPSANGEVERQNRSIMKRIKIAIAEGHNWKIALDDYVDSYRSTPHSTTGLPPADVLMGRKLRSRLPQLPQRNFDDEEMRDTDAIRKQASSEQADARRHAKVSDIKEGDTVLLRQPYQNKFTTPFNCAEHSVVERAGNSVKVKTPEGVVLKRNITHVKKIDKVNYEGNKENTVVRDGDMSGNDGGRVSAEEFNRTAVRDRRPPDKFKDFCMG